MTFLVSVFLQKWELTTTTGADLHISIHLVWKNLQCPRSEPSVAACFNSFRIRLDPAFLQSEPLHINTKCRLNFITFPKLPASSTHRGSHRRYPKHIPKPQSTHQPKRGTGQTLRPQSALKPLLQRWLENPPLHRRTAL